MPVDRVALIAEIELIRRRLATLEAELAATGDELPSSQRAAARYHRVVEASSAVVFSVPSGAQLPDGMRIERTARAWGAHPFRWLEALHPEDERRVLDEFALAREEQRPLITEARMRCPVRGTWRYVRVHAAPSFGESGAVQEWVGTVTDIDAAARAERAAADRARELQASHRLVSAVLTACDGPVLHVRAVRDVIGEIEDLEGVTANPAARAMVGGMRLAGARLSDVPALVETGVHAQLVRATEHRTDFRSTLEVPSGSGRWWLTVVVPFEDGALLTATHVTEQRNANRALEVLAAELEQRVALRTRELADTNADLESFIHAVSHDFRAPARRVAGLSEILSLELGASTSDTVRDLVHRIRAQGLRIGEDIDALLRLARVRRATLHRQSVDLSEIGGEIAQGLSAELEGREVRFDIEPGLVAVADAGLVRILLENLIGNAVKFTRGRPVAHVALGRGVYEERPAFFVQDDGAGFDPATGRRMFEVFQRLHDEASFPGTGVGLSLVDRVARRHGGWVEAEGRPGEGATIWFDLGPDPEAPPSVAPTD
jgi:signal transduction histidine kinase